MEKQEKVKSAAEGRIGAGANSKTNGLGRGNQQSRRSGGAQNDTEVLIDSVGKVLGGTLILGKAEVPRV